MRRSIRSSQLAPRIIALKVSIDTDTATSSVIIGNDDIARVDYIATGILDVYFRQPFQTTPIVLGNSIAVGERAGALAGAETTALKARLFISSHAGAEVDGDAMFFIVGRDSGFSDKFRKRTAEVKGTRVKPRMLLFHVDGTGTASIVNGKYDATLTDNGTGNYTLAFDDNFSSTPIAVGCATGTEASLAVTTCSLSSVVVETTDDAGSAADSDFYLAVLGWDSSSTHGRRRLPIMSTQRNCRMLAFQVTYDTGTPSATIGTQLASAVDDDGTGDFGVNFADAFQRSDTIAIACASGATGSFAHVVANATSAEVNVVDDAGTAQDESVDLLVFGFDSANQT